MQPRLTFACSAVPDSFLLHRSLVGSWVPPISWAVAECWSQLWTLARRARCGGRSGCSCRSRSMPAISRATADAHRPSSGALSRPRLWQSPLASSSAERIFALSAGGSSTGQCMTEDAAPLILPTPRRLPAWSWRMLARVVTWREAHDAARSRARGAWPGAPRARDRGVEPLCPGLTRAASLRGATILSRGVHERAHTLSAEPAAHPPRGCKRAAGASCATPRPRHAAHLTFTPSARHHTRAAHP